MINKLNRSLIAVLSFAALAGCASSSSDGYQPIDSGPGRPIQAPVPCDGETWTENVGGVIVERCGQPDDK